MCRLAILPPRLLRERSGDVLDLLITLETVNGGHGNGAAAWLHNGSVWLRKGAHLKNSELLKHMLKVADDVKTAFIWHTRLATHGSINDENAQPFTAPENDAPILVLAHNGVWMNYYRVARELGLVKRVKRCYRYSRYYGYFWWYKEKSDDKKSGEKEDDDFEYCYEDEDLAVDRSDSWVMAQWLAQLLRSGIDRLDALVQLHDTLRHDAVLVQFSDGDTYLVASKYVEVAKIDGQWLLASSNIATAFPKAKVYSVTGVWRYTPDRLEPLHAARILEGASELYGTATCGIGRSRTISTRVSLKPEKKAKEKDEKEAKEKKREKKKGKETRKRLKSFDEWWNSWWLRELYDDDDDEELWK